MPEPFHPDLRRAARFLPRAAVGPRSLPLVRALGRLGAVASRSKAEVVAVSEAVSVRVARPAATTDPAPALLWIHGGGLVIGSAAMDDDFCRRVARELGVVVASVEYRLAPEHPFPAPLHDCYAGLEWLAGQPGVDPRRIAVGGASAGGGLAAALALLARERGEIHPAFQLLVYPMLDDRTVSDPPGVAGRLRMWNAAANRFGWRSYLGAATAGEVPPLAAPARAEDLTGLPPAWIGVGTLDLFLDEDRAYARRLGEAGVPVELHEVPGAYHGFDMAQRKAGVSREFVGRQVAALAAALKT
ncbi:alpha/beta hydrolase [Pseudonocardia humida]|uniref:Alpha/beta hydrolase n=1 Tax=Pseudonocardia humida TaxID=2800819 RepID=A0ABT0ZSZ2_9PSEU|nr:alpha/beta hydrolase [Pseudonocardia humida]MCO1653808.1 alpha/beta hydrolase [Pseudonocardia humida]